MKKNILLLILFFITQSALSQKIILHRNTGGNLTYELYTVDSITFLPFVCGDEIRYEGQTYHTVLISTQCWMQENLNVGTMINGTSDQANNGIFEKYCYNNNTAYCTTYGGLYLWNEAMQYITTPGTQGICPIGWHIPTLVEFNALAAAVNNDGNALKAVGEGFGSGVGTNTSGFSVLLTGYRFSDGYFYGIGFDAMVWSSTETSTSGASPLGLFDYNSYIGFTTYPKSYGLSVRCIRD